MCLLCVIEPGVTPTRQQLENAADSNPHGYGYAFMTASKIITGRGMNADEMIDRFLRLRSGMPDAWAMFHARYTTHGDTSKSNCHPFRVEGNENIVLGHNGILPIDVPRGDKRSDTRIFAEEYLPDLGVEVLDDAEWRDYLEQWIGGSKVAVFSIDPRLESNVYILNESLGHWKDGIWWSNDSYKDSWYSRSLATRWLGASRNGDSCELSPAEESASVFDDAWIEDGLCNLCLSSLTPAQREYQYCAHCFLCLECYSDLDDCMCYRPAEMRSEMPSWRDWDASRIGTRALTSGKQQSLFAYRSEAWEG